MVTNMAKKSSNKQKERLFEENLVPAKPGSGELFDVSYGDDPKPVECLGMTFPNDKDRRAHFTVKLREKLKDPAFRTIEGFPIGDDEDILALSDPPYYTACPNPFLADFITYFGSKYDGDSDTHSVEPFAADVSEGKGEAFYNVHPYHTKVPHKAIMRHILHYTEPGDVVMDGFCGSGMTGVAAQLCGDTGEVTSLGFSLGSNGCLISADGSVASLGERKAVLCDLSPVATFIAAHLNKATKIAEAVSQLLAAIDAADAEWGWMYKTSLAAGSANAKLMYTVLSDVYACHNCGAEVVYWEPGIEAEKAAIEPPTCKSCKSVLNKRESSKVFETYFDAVSGGALKRAKRVPVMINATASGQRRDKLPDADDLALIKTIETVKSPFVYPTDPLRKGERYHRDGLHLVHFDRVDQFHTRRSLLAICAFLDACEKLKVGEGGMFLVTSVLCKTASLMHNIGIKKGRINLAGALPNVLYVPSTIAERNIFELLRGRIDDVRRAFAFRGLNSQGAAVTTGHAAHQRFMPDNCIDYIFVDPPFGDNLLYSELNEIWEAWLHVRTQNTPEAIMSKVQSKAVGEYQEIMKECFSEFYRVLKPGRWMTVEFHNSKNSVWNSIQEALSAAGFVVAAVQVLDKGQGTRNQMTQVGAVNKDLIISAYKPDGKFQTKFAKVEGTEAGGWEFVRAHLGRLPVFSGKDGRGNVIAERQNYLLFDRMVAFHVQRGLPVPLNAAEFYLGLQQRFPERDSMYFLPEQVSEYERQRMQVSSWEQQELLVSDEKTAIQWVRSQLQSQARRFGDLQPLYMQEAQRAWERYERPIELQTILDQNFICNDDETWRVPDPKKEADLERLRSRDLLKEFQQYLDSKGKLKVVRTEALRAGFKESWQKKDYTTIVQMAKRVPESVIQEDPALLMYFDNASLMLGE
jgi:hypothetical protein